MSKDVSITRGNAPPWICITKKTFDRLMKLSKGYMTLNDVIELLLDEHNNQ